MTLLAYCVFSLYLVAMLCLALYAVSEFGLLLQYRFWYKIPVASSVFIEKNDFTPTSTYRDTVCPSLYTSLRDTQCPCTYNDENDKNRTFYIEKTTENTIDFPHVLIQLPVYNEPLVIERLLEAIMQIRYPNDRLTIQILDDSTDETSAIIRDFLIKTKIEKPYFQDIKNIQHLQRTQRTGYKAGALAYGLVRIITQNKAQSQAEFVAIFDADFVPNADFLERTIPHFYKNDTLALVQTRWAHLNENHSILTRLQAMQLNVHFTVEQGGRNGSGGFMQFNGTAGVWRIAAIHDAGGWQADTLTEDLDLSYRAQLRGWKMLYDQHTAAPAELPMDMQSLIAQQFRWTKGGAECARTLLPMVLKADLPLLTKVNALTHLLSNLVFVAMIIAMIGSLLLPICGLFIPLPMQYWWLGFVPTGLLMVVHFAPPLPSPGGSVTGRSTALPKQEGNEDGNVTDKKADTTKNTVSLTSPSPLGRAGVGLYPLLLALSMGIGFYNFRAVWEGWTGRKSPFVRTPKQGDKIGILKKDENYIQKNLLYNILKNNKLEAFFCLALSFCFIMEILNGYYIIPLIHGLWAVGFGMVVFYNNKRSYRVVG